MAAAWTCEVWASLIPLKLNNKVQYQNKVPIIRSNTIYGSRTTVFSYTATCFGCPDQPSQAKRCGVLYPLFWVILWRLNCIYRRFGTLCSIFISGMSKKNCICVNILVHIALSFVLTNVYCEDFSVTLLFIFYLVIILYLDFYPIYFKIPYITPKEICNMICVTFNLIIPFWNKFIITHNYLNSSNCHLIFLFVYPAFT
jgi:hypothetical protein